jgi:hypothetical protein
MVPYQTKMQDAGRSTDASGIGLDADAQLRLLAIVNAIFLIETSRSWTRFAPIYCTHLFRLINAQKRGALSPSHRPSLRTNMGPVPGIEPRLLTMSVLKAEKTMDKYFLIFPSGI